MPQAPLSETPGAAPRVLLVSVNHLGNRVSGKARSRYGGCPVWWVRGSVEEQVTIFDRLPEPPSNALAEEVMDAAAALAEDEGDDMHTLLGHDEDLGLGFHAGLTLEEARAWFLGAGFEVVDDQTPLGLFMVWPPGIRRD